eukprot:TRINITY_DN66620_c9_g1_i1.p1 TRINITY_DN66620_c9_g1~~TRINITY_DN66620_c9_g1_i1.p1  ORF type:complete len:255 (-),score=35.79 TRINITY_DN66620_c9_g1_i1:289-1053(-)
MTASRQLVTNGFKVLCSSADRFFTCGPAASGTVQLKSVIWRLQRSKGGHKVMLIPMAHVAQREFYDAVYKLLSKHEWVFMEGHEQQEPPEDSAPIVHQKVLHYKLTTQFKGKVFWEPVDFDSVEDLAEKQIAARKFESEQPVGVWQNLKVMWAHYRCKREWKKFHREREQTLMTYIDMMRDFGDSVPHVAIGWGAAHMPAMYERLLSMGYRPIKNSEELVVCTEDQYPEWSSKVEEFTADTLGDIEAAGVKPKK